MAIWLPQKQLCLLKTLVRSVQALGWHGFLLRPTMFAGHRPVGVFVDHQGPAVLQAPGASKYLRKWVQVPVFTGPCPIF